MNVAIWRIFHAKLLTENNSSNWLGFAILSLLMLQFDEFSDKIWNFGIVFIFDQFSQARQYSQRSVAYHWSYHQIWHCSGKRGQHIRFWANGQSKASATNFSQIHGNKEQRGHLWLSIKTATKIDWSYAGVPLDNLSFGLGKQIFLC